MKYVDLETEILPNLKEKHADVLVKYMLDPKKKQKDCEGEIGYSRGGINVAVKHIFRNIDEIIALKKARDEFVKKYGGWSNLEDLALCLSETERNVLNGVVLSLNPQAFIRFQEKNPTISLSYVVRNIEKSLQEVIERKKECDKFIKNNGGEDFLINEFGPTLSDEHFEFMLMFLMDYHYLSINDAAKKMGRKHTSLETSLLLIEKHLEDYKTRRKQVNKLIEDAGGTEKVLNEFYLKLGDIDRLIFEERILAYHQTTINELSKKLNISENYCQKRVKNLTNKFNEFVELNLQSQKKQ